MIFAIINHQYIDIHHTKKQGVNVLSSRSFLFLKAVFYFISQCITVPYIESGLCELGKGLDNFNLTMT